MTTTPRFPDRDHWPHFFPGFTTRCQAIVGFAPDPVTREFKAVRCNESA